MQACRQGAWSSDGERSILASRLFHDPRLVRLQGCRDAVVYGNHLQASSSTLDGSADSLRNQIDGERAAQSIPSIESRGQRGVAMKQEVLGSPIRDDAEHTAEFLCKEGIAAQVTEVNTRVNGGIDWYLWFSVLVPEHELEEAAELLG